jgi:hydrogenase-1 operon protein HyaF
MRSVNIPIRSLTPEPAEMIDVMPMPHEMATFEMPRVPEPGPGHDVAGARDVLARLLSHFDAWQEIGGEPPALDLAHMAPDSLRVLNETLGEGEVAAIVKADPSISIQETVFAGVWREQHFGAAGALLHDYLLVAPIPPVVSSIAAERAAETLRTLELPAGAMNVAALLHELADAMQRCGAGVAPHVINLTLLPLSREDTSHLDLVLDGGSVVILSRGFGNCRISSTAARHVWRVQYFNNMQTLILNTLEVVQIPEVAIASREDLLESRERLADLVQWMGESCVAPSPSPPPSPAGGRGSKTRSIAPVLAGAPPLLPLPLAGEGRGEGATIGTNTRLECKICWTVYDPALGDQVWQIPPGTPFAELPPHWTCPNCSAEKQNFLVLDD